MQALQKTFIPSHYQQAIFNWIKEGRGDAVVKAAAGSGKTTTLVEASKLLHTDNAVFLAFNKHVADELSKRVTNMNCKTIHSIGNSCLRSHLGKVTLDENKYFDLAKPYAEEISQGLKKQHHRDMQTWTEAMLDGEDLPKPSEPPSPADVARQLKNLAHFVRVTLTDVDQSAAVENTCYHYSVIENGYTLEMLYRPLLGMLREGDRIAANRGLIDYDDMIYLPCTWGLYPQKQADFVFVDEAQDLSPAQLDLVLKLRSPGGRMVFVGDHHQCQPAGTMISLPRNQQKPIEELQVGDEVVSYDRNGSAFVGLRNQGRKVLAVSNRPYRGRMITVKAADRATECTPNHRWVARWSDRLPNKYVTYLMQQGDRFRVGWCQLFNSVGCLHLAARAQGEKADAAWILGVHTNRTKASIQESVIAAMFGLPTIPFEPVNGANHLTKEAIDEFFTVLNELDPMQLQKAKDCLDWFGRDIQYPFYSKTERQRQGRTTIFETTASNLISSLMSIPYFEGDRTVRWASIDVESAIKECAVYSLKIETHETYVADGLATHNSIFGFAGASSDSIQQIINRTQATVLPLSICYRCPAKHIKLAQTIVPSIEAREDAPEGILEDVKYSKLFEFVQEGDLIISRCTAPVIKLCIELIGQKIPARVRGRDIGKSLTTIVRDVAKHPDFNYDDFGLFLKDYAEAKIAKLENKKNAQSQIESFSDRIQGVEVCFESFDANSITELCFEIEALFSDGRASVMLSTVHRAKGLENNRVFILEPDKLPLTWRGQQEWEALQEQNLFYVALTRAKVALYFIR